MRVSLPNSWQPRHYQRPAWDYLENGGKHAELIWHRRSGKDEISLHRTAVAAFERVATYWHMLPLATQARKAIWSAINPHTGKRRIDEAFPPEIIENKNDQEMFIRFKNGSTWQVVGSDNFNSMVGSPPAGIVYSEWALANPSARAYLRPIIAENNGWQIFITTPRGRNHAHQTYQSAITRPDSFAQILTAHDTDIFTQEKLEEELQNYIDEFGKDIGLSLFEQEYLCSFEAAILGSIYGSELNTAAKEGRIHSEDIYDEALKVHAVFDLGHNDSTAIWFFQVANGEVRFIDYYEDNLKGIPFYNEVLRNKPYKYGDWLWLPHDARAKTLAANGRSIEQQFRDDFKWNVRIVPELSLVDGIQAARKSFPKVHFGSKCADATETLKQYQYEYDDKIKILKKTPKHDWTSHCADAFRYACLVWREEMAPKEKPKPRFDTDLTINELIKRQARKHEDE